jgi:hypothetical protein
MKRSDHRRGPDTYYPAMKTRLKAAALLAVLVAAANGQPSVQAENPKPSFGIYAAETGGGFLGELAAATAVTLAVYGFAAANGADFFDESSWPYAVLWAAALVPAVPAGSAAGAYIVGHHYGGDGEFWAAGLGGLAGLMVFALGAQITDGSSSTASIPIYALAVVSPAVGATVGYNLSRTRVSYGSRFMPGSVGLAAVRDAKGIAHPSLKVHLLSVRF